MFLRDIYKDALVSAGYKVTLAGEGYEALWKIRFGEWSLVLLDVLLPQITGVEILKKLTEIDRGDLIKLIVMLTNTDNEKELQDIRVFTDKIWTKSRMTPNDLAKKVQEYLG